MTIAFQLAVFALIAISFILLISVPVVFATPEASFGFHTDCGFSYYHSRLPGYLGNHNLKEFLLPCPLLLH